MNVLVVGGSGYVGLLVLPYLAQRHTLRIFDRKPPQEGPWHYFEGDVNDPDALAQACQEMDALLYMAMGKFDLHSPEGIIAAYDVNVKGLHLALHAAHQAGISHAVYTSSMSVYYERQLKERYFPDEDVTPDARNIYGFTKRMGEEVCRFATRNWGMSVNALRLCYPRLRERWLAETRPGVPTLATDEEDVARALLAALDYKSGGFQAFMISGDYEGAITNLSKAKRLLGWEPLARPQE
jgi:nucleoside-diphosphate-sugar epimerase